VKRLALAVVIVSGALWLGGCGKPVATAAPAYPGLATAAQPQLPTIKLWVGSKAMTAEMAVNEREEHTGMMFRTNIPPDTGMIFVYPYPQQVAFWMMNCPLPLDAAYMDPNGVILELHDFHPNDTNNVVSATPNIQFVLETSQGWFKKNNIGVGTVIATEKGPLRAVFSPNQ
jgi:uncharacterized membrane protein (UPF0127 family)